MKSLSVLTIGHVTHDLYGDRILPGGCAFYGAKTAKALGAESKLATALGRDFACEAGLADLDVQAIECEKTTVFTNLYPEGHPRKQRVRAQAVEVVPKTGLEKLYEADLVLIAPVMGEVDLHRWNHIRGKKVTALALQGFLKHAPAANDKGERPVVARKSPFDPRRLQGVDALFFSIEDLALFGSPALLNALIQAVDRVFMTQSEKGCRVFASQKPSEVPAKKTRAKDPTGAGDTFAAATALALAAGASPEQAAQIGAAAASIVVEGPGGACLSRVSETRERILAPHKSKPLS